MRTDLHEPWLIDGASESEIQDSLAEHAARWLIEVGAMLRADGFPASVAEAALVKLQPVVEQYCERHLPHLLRAAGVEPATRH